MKCHECATKEIELDRKLSCQVSIDKSEHLVRGKNVLRIVLEVEDRYQVCLAHLLDLSVSSVSLLAQWHVELVIKDGVVKQLHPLLFLFWSVIENHGFQVI